jgi:hypothetical protein
VTALNVASLLIGILAVLCAGIWRCARLLFRIAIAVEAVPQLAEAVQQHDHRITRLEVERGISP